MELKIRKNGDVYIIDVNGEMDLYNSYKLKELVMKMLEKNVQSFIINLEQVDYIDSSGIGALIYICSTVKKMNLKLAITNIHGSVKKVIELTKLMGYFPITNSIEEGRRLCELKGAYGRFLIEHQDFLRIQLDNGALFESRQLADLLKDSKEVFLMAATAGHALLFAGIDPIPPPVVQLQVGVMGLAPIPFLHRLHQFPWIPPASD